MPEITIRKIEQYYEITIRYDTTTIKTEFLEKKELEKVWQDIKKEFEYFLEE